VLWLSCYERKEIKNWQFCSNAVTLIQISGRRGHTHQSFLHDQLGLTTLLLTVLAQRNSVADFLQLKCDFFCRNQPFCIFETPFGGLRGNA